MAELALVRHQNHPISPLDDIALDLSLQIGAVCQSVFNGDASGGDENGLDAQMGEGVQRGNAGEGRGGGGVDAAQRDDIQIGKRRGLIQGGQTVGDDRYPVFLPQVPYNIGRSGTGIQKNR